jgi:adenylate kinase
MAEYRAKTEPIIPIYQARGLLARVDGMGDIADVTGAIEAILDAG